jgi:putative PEP-CTERM system histidine kinase
MPISAVLSYAAAYFSLIMAAAVLLRDRHSFVHRMFATGMFLFAVEELLRGFTYGAIFPEDVIYWQKSVLAVSALIPGVWLGFSLSYARVNVHSFVTKWKWALFTIAVAPVPFVAGFWKSLVAGQVYGEIGTRWAIPLRWPGWVLQFFLLSLSILILFNLERTIRSSMGRMRWQIKFMALGVGGIFALRIYVASQSLLFYGLDTGFGTVSAVALIAANLLFALSLYRGRSLNVDVYLSAATLQNSLTLILTGIYLISVGVLAHLTRYFPANQSLPLDAFIVSLSLTALAVLLLSNRLRRKLRLFVSRHFSRPIYDYRNVWMELTQRTTSLVDANELSTAVSRMVSESLEILSVSVWLVDDSGRRLTLAGSTAFSSLQARELEKAGKSAADIIESLRKEPGCVDLDGRNFLWPKEIMDVAPDFFRKFRMRYAVGLHAGDELVGVMTLNNDRVGDDKTLSAEDCVLLETLAAQLASSLLNLKLSDRLRRAKEVETFQTVSTFFVHDLKNLASRLSLTMQNLPANFDNPEFRADALRVISTSLTTIDDMCSRLAMLKQNIALRLDKCDFNRLVIATLDEFKGNLKAELKEDLRPVPKVLIDSEQIHKVLTNLVMNANEAVNGNGVIRVTTHHDGNTVGFAIRDNGCGMSEEFMEKSLFRPFQTTKKRGLGIGLFHSKLIVEAHRGTFEVNSSLGIGTEFRVILPISQ